MYRTTSLITIRAVWLSLIQRKTRTTLLGSYWWTYYPCHPWCRNYQFIELLYLNSTFQKYVISHCIAIGQQFQSSSSKSNCILVFHRAGTETKTSQGTLFKSLGHDFISVKTTYSYFSTQRRWIYLYDSCLA